ncbi:hypothetical protein Tco_1555144 [Tanacetum coccineum]
MGGSGGRVVVVTARGASEVVGRVDPVVGSILGVDRKIPPEKFSGGGWPEKMAVAGASSTAASPAVESFVNSSEMLENQENNKSRSDKGYHAVPPPYTGNFIPFKPDLTFMDEIVESENINVITVVTPSNVKKVKSNHESC